MQNIVCIELCDVRVAAWIWKWTVDVDCGEIWNI